MLVPRRGALALPLGLAGLAAGCDAPAPTARAPAMPADPSGRADPEQRALLESLARLGPRPIETLEPAEARRQPAFPQAVRARLAELGRQPAPRPLPRVEPVTVEGAAGALPARLYAPRPSGPAALPVIVYFHGGGWVIADMDAYDASARAIAEESDAIVLSVGYRQGPEHRFPAAHDDAAAAWRWAVANAARLGGDVSRMAVAGESAGGNLALHVAAQARGARVGRPRAMGLIYPVGGTDTETPSYRTFANAKPLNRDMILWFVRHYTRGPDDLQDPRLDVIGRGDASGLPPAVIVTAEIDPLREDGRRLAEKLRAAGVPVSARDYEGVTHEFFGADAVLSKAREAQAFLGGEMRRLLSASAPGRGPGRRAPHA